MPATAFYKGQDSNVIGGPARVMITAATYAAPTRLSEIFDKTTYALNATYGWRECGLTDADTVINVQANAQEFTNQQFGLFRIKPNEWRGSVQSSFLEINQANKTNLMSFAKAATDPVVDEHRTNYVADVAFERVRLAIGFIDDFGKLHAYVFPQGQWDGSAITQNIARNAVIHIPMTWAVFADDDLVDPTTGLAIIRYDLDQF